MIHTRRARFLARSGRPGRRGLSLLEVILALGILGLAMAAIGELMRVGARSAEAARDLSTAQMLCETVMSEIGAGLMPPAMVASAPVQDPRYADEWNYSIAIEQVDQEGMIAVQVTVEQNPAHAASPVSFTLTRWMIDPMSSQTADSQVAGETGF